MPGDRPGRNASYGWEIFAAEFLDRIREGFRGVLRGPRFLFVKNDLVHARAADPDHGRATSLALERDKPKRFLNPRVNEQIGGAIKARELDRISAVLDPFHVPNFCLKLSQLFPFRAGPDNEQFKFMGPAFRQYFKRCEQRLNVFLLSEPSHIEQKFSIRRDSQ